MSVTNTESFTTPRDSLPNVFTNVTAREIDFVSRFGQNWDALRDLLGIMQPIKKEPGTRLAATTATVELEDGSVGPGKVVPYSKVTTVETVYADIDIEKYSKAVPLEDVSKYGARRAVQKSDEAFLYSLQNKVLSDFYTFLNTGSLTGTAASWQAALATAKGLVLDKFNKLRKTVTDVVGFANVLDFYGWLGSAQVTVQTQFGLTYIKNFMGYSTLFLLSEPDIEPGTVIACPVENIDLYYIDPGDPQIRELGLDYTVQGETNLIGFHANGNYSTVVGEAHAVLGMKLWAEYLNGIANVTVSDSD